MKYFIVLFHGGYLWLDKAYSIDFNFISRITCLSQAGVDPTPFLKKDMYPLMIARVKDKFDVVRANRGFLILSIYEPTVHFAETIFSYKML